MPPARATRVARARALGATTTSTARARRSRVARRASTTTRASPELLDLAALVDVVPSDLALSDAERALGKCAFAALSASSAAFAGKVRRRATTTRRDATRGTTRGLSGGARGGTRARTREEDGFERRRASAGTKERETDDRRSRRRRRAGDFYG